MAVRDIFRLPALFLFVFILFFLLLFALTLLSLWGSLHSEGAEVALQRVVARVPGTLLGILPISVFLSLLIVLLAIALRPGSRFLSLVIPLAGAFALLIFGYQVLHDFGARAGGAGAPVLVQAPQAYLVPGVFNSTAGKVIYLETLQGNSTSSMVLLEGGNPGRNLLYFPQGQVSVSEQNVVLRMAGHALEIDPEPVYSSLFRKDPVLQPLFSDLSFLGAELESMFQASSFSFYFTVLALVAAVYSCGIFLRLSRWPLLNAVLALLAMRGLLALLRLLREGVVFELGKALRNPQALQVLPELVLLILGVLFLFLDLLFVPFERLRRE